MKLPAYGRALWERQKAGERPPVACLLVGSSSRRPQWMPGFIPRLAVKPAAWHRRDRPIPEELQERARREVAAAIHAGYLVQRPCEICGSRSTEAHHSTLSEWDRAKDLNVRWLCSEHREAIAAAQRRARREKFEDWRIVRDMTVLAVDVREPDEIETGPDGWDAWFWLLADVQEFAREVILLTPTIAFDDPLGRYAPERNLEVFAWCSRRPYIAGIDEVEMRWPPWWPHGDSIFQRNSADVRIAA